MKLLEVIANVSLSHYATARGVITSFWHVDRGR